MRSDQGQVAQKRVQRWGGEQPYSRSGPGQGTVGPGSRTDVTQTSQKCTPGPIEAQPQVCAAQMCSPDTRALMSPGQGLRLCILNSQ